MNPINFAHRGASGYCPENTLAAFEKAVELGASGIETDVQMTRDGDLVLIHDETLMRTTTGRGLVKDHTLDELKQLDAGSWFHRIYSSETIPTLEELILVAKSHNIFLNIELKNGIIPYFGIEERVIENIQLHGMQDQVIISSFNHDSLVRCKMISPQINTGLLFKEYIADLWGYAEKVKVNALHPKKVIVSKSFIKQAHDQGLKVFPWTVNKKAEMRRIMVYDPDGIITDYPDRFKSLL